MHKPPKPRGTIGHKRLGVVFYNLRDGQPVDEIENQYLVRPVSYFDFEARWYMRDHYAVWDNKGRCLHYGPCLDALGKPAMEYSS